MLHVVVLSRDYFFLSLSLLLVFCLTSGGKEIAAATSWSFWEIVWKCFFASHGHDSSCLGFYSCSLQLTGNKFQSSLLFAGVE